MVKGIDAGPSSTTWKLRAAQVPLVFAAVLAGAAHGLPSGKVVAGLNLSRSRFLSRNTLGCF